MDPEEPARVPDAAPKATPLPLETYKLRHVLDAARLLGESLHHPLEREAREALVAYDQATWQERGRIAQDALDWLSRLVARIAARAKSRPRRPPVSARPARI